MPDILLLLACTGWYLAASGNLPPGFSGAFLEAEWEWGESWVMKTYRASTVVSAPSLGDTWLHEQSSAHHLLVPQQEPAWDSHSPPCPSAHPVPAVRREPLACCLGPGPDGCLQESFYRNQGQEKPAHQVQHSL